MRRFSREPWVRSASNACTPVVPISTGRTCGNDSSRSESIGPRRKRSQRAPNLTSPVSSGMARAPGRKSLLWRGRRVGETARTAYGERSSGAAYVVSDRLRIAGRPEVEEPKARTHTTPSTAEVVRNLGTNVPMRSGRSFDLERFIGRHLKARDPVPHEGGPRR
jgi:hypothetical protein